MRMTTAGSFLTKIVWSGLLLTLPGCGASRVSDASGPSGSQENACDVVRAWEADASEAARRITPIVDVSTGDTVYQFAPLAGPIKSLRAVCGNGPYSECNVSVGLRDGGNYAFVDLSRFALWRADDGLWMAYRVLSPKASADPAKRRVIKVAPQPATLCNEIGDYSDLM